ncbi:CheR family methyltransferase [Chlorogloea sp. CCALA 695]|uniref:CheR family methyltransferase n=1 Tax=Chlorogloea sp. CCALA 695 TaxID=2107693 RepID=UPI000D068882|nr:CheR family methyltransferase [Chlorogloea sp. CCALA 695]PSB29147.1 ATPase [Chlorogloea sp. CCALA 695]
MTSEQTFGQSNDEVKSPPLEDNLFPIVGIAASAGGLEAFIDLLTYLPVDTGMAFALIQHLAPDHKSLLTEILAKKTKMPVSEVVDGVMVEPNHVYIIAPNTTMILAQGRLRLAPRERVEGKYMPGDAFFTSLAAEQGSKAIAVILSGGDGDGSLALTHIKAAGGVTFAQCNGTAKFDSMPNTAVATGNVDFILPPQEIAEEIAKLSIHPFIAPQSTVKLVENSPQSQEGMQLIFALLKSSTGVDFSQYKLATIARRMQRRMLLYKLEKLEDYAQYLQNNEAEVKALYAEILIHVTGFFRDPLAFQQLTRSFPIVTQNKTANSPIRIWVAGCSTGEEAYSIAICLLEFLGEKSLNLLVQIFATDISETAIELARTGVYSDQQMVGVSPERRNRFFTKLEFGGYRISKAVRELCIFARQDLSSDPPFANLDLVSCRNVMIYLAESLQKQVLSVFHYSLNSKGILMLGNSESTTQNSQLFGVVDKKHRIYTKNLADFPPSFSFVTSKYPSAIVDNPKPTNNNPANSFDLDKETDRLILNRYAPVGVVIDDKMTVLQIRGETSFYLKISPGTPSFDLFKMVRKDLLVALRAAVYEAQRQDVLVRKERLRLENESRVKIINLEVIPFKNAIAQKSYFLILFTEAIPAVSNSIPVNREGLDSGELEREIDWLRQELAIANQERAAAGEYLQAVTQEQEYTNQDLKVANEEILSSNEELQSINEELETAKEEIQATNEELKTTNEELRSRNLQLHDVNNDLTNLIGSIDIPILMLTNDLRVRRFTPTAQKLLNFIPTDVGRPFRDINANLDVPNLEELVVEVINTLKSIVLEVQTDGGYWYNLHIRPYRTVDNRIDGAVVVLIDIDALKRGATNLESARNYAEAIVETVQVPLLVLNSDLRVKKANRLFYRTFEVSSRDTINSSIFDLGNGEWNFSSLRVLLADVLAKDTEIQGFEVNHNFKQIGQKTMLLNACKILHEDSIQLLLSIEDITERKLLEQQRDHALTQEQAARHTAEVANVAKDEFLSIVSHELRNPLTAILGWVQLLRKRGFDQAKTDHALETIERSARAQNKLIEDLLETSRITAGKFQLNVSAIALAPVISSAIEIARILANAKNIQIETVFTPKTLLVSGDKDRLQQIISNLLTNAIKFTPSGGQVTVSLDCTASQAQIQVSDTGQGISAEFLPFVFERFRQANSTSTRSEGGLGLGLSIVEHLVGLHGGTVSAASPGEGQGATFTVQLPLLETRQGNKKEITSSPQISLLLLKGLRVLVVEDDAGLLELVKTILEEYGAEVTEVNSAKNAIASLTNNPGKYDVLLSDIGMPNEDGYSLLRQVRELSQELGGQIPAAALTAYARAGDRTESFAAGFQRHIAKPVHPEELVSIIAELAQINQETK